jgi:hypothetical protein
VKVLSLLLIFTLLCFNSSLYAEEKKEEKKPRQERVATQGHSSGNINMPKDGAAIVFAVIGLVAIVSWVPMMYLALNDIIVNDAKYEHDQILGLEFNFLSPPDGVDFKLSGNYSSLYYASHLRKPGKRSGIGIAALLGRFDFEAKQFENDKEVARELHSSSFLMAGPSVRFFLRETPTKEVVYLNVELLAGKSDTYDDFLSTARVKMNVSISQDKRSFWNDTFWGVNLGATYYQSDELEGILNNASHFNYSLGMTLDKAF